MNPGGSVLNKFVQDGSTHMGQARNTVQDPTLNVHPAQLYFDRLGVPDNIDPNNLDSLPRTSETIASMYQHATPTVVAQYVVDSSLYNESYEHFVVLPPIQTDKTSGVECHVLRFRNAPFTSQPEKSSAPRIRHSMEKHSMTLERLGQAMELDDDFAMTPEGRMVYDKYIETMSKDLILSAQMAGMTSMLRCFDNKRAYVSRFGGGYANGHGLDDHTSMFGIMFKEEKAFYRLADHARTMGMRQNAKPFTHAFMTYNTRTQAALGDEFETEYYRRGPNSSRYLEGGTEAVQTLPGSGIGIKIVTEPDYTLDGTELGEHETYQLLENHVSVGHWNAILFDRLITDEEYPVPLKDMNLGFINLEAGDGQIQVQSYTDLLRAMIIWQADGELREAAYNNMTSGGRAETKAKELGIPSIVNRDRPEDGALVDPFIVDGFNGVRSTTRYVGNMHTAYLDSDVCHRIAGSARNAVMEKMTERDFVAMRAALDFLEENYNADPTSGYAERFADAMIFPTARGARVGGEDVALVPASRNMHGCFDIPAPNTPRLIAADTTLRGIFPGMSSMQHLRTIRDFTTSAGMNDWIRELGPLGSRFETKILQAVEGLAALEKYARVEKGIWSSSRAPNAFFCSDALPVWMRGVASNNENDAFLQNIVIGLRYPTGITEDTARANIATIPGAPSAIYLTEEAIVLGAGGKSRALLMLEKLGIDEMLPAPLTNDEKEGIVFDLLENGRLDNYAKDALINPDMFAADTFGNPDIVPIGFAGVKDLLKQRVPGPGKAPIDNVVEGNAIANTVALAMLLLRRKVDDIKQSGSGEVLDEDSINATIVMAKLQIKKDGNDATPASGAKRKFVHSDAASASAARRAAHTSRRAGVLPAGRMSAEVNTTLSFSPRGWGRYFSTRAAADLSRGLPRLTPTDTTSPGNVWMTQQAYGDTMTEDEARLANDYLVKASRAKYDIDMTRMGKFSGAAFSAPVANAHQAKRHRTSESGMSSGARYVTMGQPRSAFPDEMSDSIRSSIRNHFMDIDDGDNVEIFSEFASGRDALMVGTNSRIVQEANMFFQYRWKSAVDRYGDDLVMLSQHLLLLGQRVHRDSFIQMAQMGVPAPISMLIVDPMIEMKMTHAVFASANCGNIYYAFQDLSTGYDPRHKTLTAYMTIWLKAFVQLPQNVYIAENISFNGYIRGGDGSLVRSIYEDNGIDEEPLGGFDYDPTAPAERRASRFVLPIGATTKLANIPNPLPLNGSFGGKGAMSGLGHYVNEDHVAGDHGRAAFDSALVVDEICQFSRLNNAASHGVMSVDDYFQRRDAVKGTFNMVCFQADQYGRNKATGSHKRRQLTGTGHLGQLCEGVTPILNGKAGMISKKLQLERE